VIRSLAALIFAAGGCMGPSDALFGSSAITPLQLIETHPADGAEGIATDATIELTFNQPVDPRHVAGGWSLRTGGVGVTSVATVDLPARKLRIRAARGMSNNQHYILVLGPPLRSFDAAPLELPAPIRFLTGLGPAGAPPPPPSPSLRAQVLPAFALAGCERASCHAGATPARGLDLARAEGLLAAVGRLSQNEPGQKVVTSEVHATSYLLWKGMGLPRTVGHRTPVLTPDGARVVADWIDAGAKDD
jgi:hypothetical protein